VPLSVPPYTTLLSAGTRTQSVLSPSDAFFLDHGSW